MRRTGQVCDAATWDILSRWTLQFKKKKKRTKKKERETTHATETRGKIQVRYYVCSVSTWNQGIHCISFSLSHRRAPFLSLKPRAQRYMKKRNIVPHSPYVISPVRDARARVYKRVRTAASSRSVHRIRIVMVLDRDFLPVLARAHPFNSYSPSRFFFLPPRVVA